MINRMLPDEGPVKGVLQIVVIYDTLEAGKRAVSLLAEIAEIIEEDSNKVEVFCRYSPPSMAPTEIEEFDLLVIATNNGLCRKFIRCLEQTLVRLRGNRVSTIRVLDGNDSVLD